MKYFDPTATRLLKNDRGKRIYFTAGSDIKRTLFQTETDGMKKPHAEYDYQNGRYVGMIESWVRFAVVYFGDHVSPILWTKRFFEREKKAIYLYAIMNLRFPEHRCDIDYYLEGIFHVKNVKSFLASFHPSTLVFPHRKRIYKTKTSFGAGLRKLWLVPQTHEGAAEYRELMTRKVEEDYPEFYDALQKTGKYFFNRGAYNGWFYLLGECDEYVTVVLHLDCCMLRDQEQFIRGKGLGNRYVFLCRPWIIPYVRAVFSDMENVLVTNLDAELPPELRSKPIPNTICELVVETID